jgi:uncharacterized repeat protein (TIGR03843 family)
MSRPSGVPDGTAGSSLGLEPEKARRLLCHGEIEVVGRLVDASNATLFCQVSLEGVSASCVHKPVAGERPLWDFPDGTLAGREVAAYLVSEAAGWGIVPPTVLRQGPFGPGMCQLWVDTDPADEPGGDGPDQLVALQRVVAEGWLPVMDALVEGGRPAVLVHRDDERLRRIAVFDAVINNADRKGGHLLVDGGRVYGVDHGVCFSIEDKLRTLLWGWRGEPLDAEDVERLVRLREQLGADLGARLGEHLTRGEVMRTRRRVDRLLRFGVHPAPRGDWPAVPWPPI